MGLHPKKVAQQPSVNTACDWWDTWGKRDSVVATDATSQYYYNNVVAGPLWNELPELKSPIYSTFLFSEKGASSRLANAPISIKLSLK